jgi:hypothetical protein
MLAGFGPDLQLTAIVAEGVQASGPVIVALYLGNDR